MAARTEPCNRSLLAAITLLAALVAGIASWLPGLHGPYQFDDHATPLSDPASQSFAAWRQTLGQTLRPLTKLSYALEADAGFAARPAPRRALSLLLHALAALLLYRLVVHLEPGLGRPGAVVPALLWLLHPVHADSLLMLSGRSAVLAGGLLLATLLALERVRPVMAGWVFVLACLARETALAGLLPAAVIVATRPGASVRTTLRQMLPLLVGATAILCWLAATPRYVALAEFSFQGRPLWPSIVAQVSAVPVGLTLLLQPQRLSIDYGIGLPATGRDPLFVSGVLLFAAAAAGITWCLCKRRARATAVGLALWLAALLPTQSFVPKLDALSNRPLALALAGLLLAAAPLIAVALERAREVSRHAGTFPKLVAALPGAGALAIAAMLAAATAQRSELFDSELRLWQDAAVKSRSNARPHLQYALLLARAGRDFEARQALARARAIDPFSARIEDLWQASRTGEDAP
jgi:hypothetical protein